MSSVSLQDIQPAQLSDKIRTCIRTFPEEHAWLADRRRDLNPLSTRCTISGATPEMNPSGQFWGLAGSQGTGTRNGLT